MTYISQIYETSKEELPPFAACQAFPKAQFYQTPCRSLHEEIDSCWMVAQSRSQDLVNKRTFQATLGSLHFPLTEYQQLRQVKFLSAQFMWSSCTEWEWEGNVTIHQHNITKPWKVFSYDFQEAAILTETEDQIDQQFLLQCCYIYCLLLLQDPPVKAEWKMNRKYLEHVDKKDPAHWRNPSLLWPIMKCGEKVIVKGVVWDQKMTWESG